MNLAEDRWVSKQLRVPNLSLIRVQGVAGRSARNDQAAYASWDVGVSQNWEYLFEGPHKNGYSTLGSRLGSPYFGTLPCLGRLGCVSACFILTKVCCWSHWCLRGGVDFHSDPYLWLQGYFNKVLALLFL